MPYSYSKNVYDIIHSSTILIVDDSGISRRRLKLDLAAVSFSHILEASSAEEALEVIKTTSPDLFLIDMLMPGMNGNELTTILRNSEQHKNTPIIIITASNEEQLIQESFNIGANDFLYKPWNAFELTARVTSHLERYKAILAYNKSTQRFQEAMEISVDGIWEYDILKDNIYISPSCHKMLCIKEDKNNFNIAYFINLLHEDDRNNTFSLIKKSLAHKRPIFNFECRIKLKNNTPRWISTSAKIVEFMPDGSPKRIIGISKNITSQIVAQKHLERYGKDMRELADERAQIIIHSERLAAIGTMSAGIAHEINNPLSYINGNIQLLKKVIPYIIDALKAENSNIVLPDNIKKVAINIPEIISALADGANRVSEIIKSMKNFSRKESDSNVFSIENITQPIDDALVLCQGALKKGITVVKNYELQEFSIPMHKQQITQVLINLIHNAAQAMEYSGQLIISATRKDDKFIEIKVSDTGPGIPDDLINKVFNPFFTTKPENEGTGIGLSISKTIIRDHNGTLTASNNPETGGAEFSIILPDREHNIKELNISQSEPPATKIVLAENSEMMQQIIKQRLSIYSCNIICTPTEEETVSMIEQEKPDAIILSMSKSQTSSIINIIDKLIEKQLFIKLFVINDINSPNLTEEALLAHCAPAEFPQLKVISTQNINNLLQ